MNGNKPGPRQKSAVDWDEVRRRLEAAGAAIERVWAPEPAEKDRILRARARALATEAATPEAAETLEILEFSLAYEKYAFESRFVREVHPLDNLTPLPCTPQLVAGIVNVRGEILSVVDIKKFFDLPEKGLTDLNKVIVLQSEGMLFGVLADAVLGTRRIALAELQPSLPTLTGIREKYLKGVTPERAVVLDAAKLLADESIVVHETVQG